MITLFPAACEDELDFSIFARYCARKPYHSKRAFVEEIFGKGTAIATIGLTSNIEYFIGELAPGHSYSAENFINQHTLLPYHALFLEPDQVARLREDMCIDNGPGMHMRAGLMASRIPLPPFLKLCAACIDHDRQQHGFCYWHRKHQPFGVEVCAAHNIQLIHTSTPTTNRQTRYEFITAEQAIKEMHSLTPPVPTSFHHLLAAIARSVAWALEQQSWSPGLASIHTRYLALLEQHGLATAHGHVRIAELLQRFHVTYSVDFQRRLRCELSENSSDMWLTRLVRKPKHAQHPLYHLLLMLLLGHSSESFFTLEVELEPFGDGPWPCLNPVCDAYHQRIILSCATQRSRYTNDQLVGTFECPQCGFTYAQTRRSEIVDPFQRQRIVSVGPTWEAWLRDRWKDGGYSLRGLARELGVDSNTITKHAARLDLPFPRPGSRAAAPLQQQGIQSNDDRRKTYRQAWLQALREYPKVGVKFIRSIVPAKIYTWLYRNDHDWLMQHYPRNRTESTRTNRIDWSERDRNLSTQIYAAAQSIRALPGKPKQITVAALGRQLGHLALLQRHLDKLPLTRAVIEEVVETRTSWAVRRIQYVTDESCKENICLQQWELIRASGVERLIEEPIVREAITLAINVMSREIDQ